MLHADPPQKMSTQSENTTMTDNEDWSLCTENVGTHPWIPGAHREPLTEAQAIEILRRELHDLLKSGIEDNDALKPPKK